MLGNKIICQKWGSGYCIQSGTVENGPALRNISAFPIDIDKDMFIHTFLPKGEIPPFGPQKILPQAEMKNEVYLILGDTLTSLAAICNLKFNFIWSHIL